MQPRFFFDVADIDYIEDKWNRIKKYCDRQSVVGITTNPGIWDKAKIKTFDDMRVRLADLCELITEIRGDDNGVVYVQPPFSKMMIHEISRFIEIVAEQSDGHTKVGCKLPPYTDVLNEINNWEVKYGIDFNVTGIADCSTALMAASYNPRYISIIPGRMEEAGIDAMLQINYVRHALLEKTEIITGAMRTVDCLRRVCSYGTIPTIGTRVWDKILTEVGADKFNALWSDQEIMKIMSFSPTVDERMTNLSISFFEQMDSLGKDIYGEFKKYI